MSLNYENTYKTRITNYDTETKSSDVKKKIKNFLEQNFEGKKNYMKLDEDDTQPRNLNSKYQNLILVWNILILLFLFIVYHTSEERFDRIWSCDTKPE